MSWDFLIFYMLGFVVGASTMLKPYFKEKARRKILEDKLEYIFDDNGPES